MTDDYAWWRAAVAGEHPPIHDEAECGYFKVRDRRGLNKQLAPIKRPWVACAIWRDEAGILQAELAGSVTAVEALWPYCAKYPIAYEAYAFWHANERFPEAA
jgi:hypothetical protein